MQSNQAEIIQQSSNKYLIWGTLDFSTVPGLMQQIEVFFKTLGKSATGQTTVETVVIDLSRITDCNSAALALLLEIFRCARTNNISLQIENLPQTVLTIAKSYGAEKEIRDICNE